MNPTLLRLLVLFAGTALSSATFAAPSMVIPPMPTTAGVTAPVASGFSAHLRKIASKSTTLISPKATKSALGASDGNCGTDACGEKLAKRTKARFVLSSSVSNSDEIFTVSMSLYDAALKKRTESKEVCELCAVEEVDGSIDKAFAGLSKALSAKIPPPAPTLIAVTINSEPKGAHLQIDGKDMGLTPFTGKVKPGEHDLVLRKAKFKTMTRKFSAMDKPVSLKLSLAADKPEPKSLEPELPAALRVPPVTQPAEQPALSGSSPRLHTGTVIGMGIGGVILAGVGTWLVMLDGEITCDDGKTRTECKTVYNTKPLGLPVVGLGAGLIGAAIAVAILDSGASSAPAVSPTADGGAVVHYGWTF